MAEYIVNINEEEVGEFDFIAVESLTKGTPLIRCCDCIHFEYFEDQFVQMTRCDVHDRCPDYTDYCSWAERKDNG